MAEVGLAVVQTLLAALQCPEVKEICSIWDYEARLEELNQTVITIKNVLKDADSQLELSYEQRGYVKELKDAVYEADDLFDEFVTLTELKQLRGSLSKTDRFFKKVRLFFSSDESKFSQAYRMFRKVKEIRNKLNAIVDNHQKFALTVDYKPLCLRRKETCSYIDVNDIIGRDDDKKAIIETLLESKDQDVRFLTVVGVGGLGKTALAQLVYNDEHIEREFEDSKFWVCVSDQDKQQFDVKAILSKILGQTSSDGYTMQLMQQKIQEKLGGKKYLLVLDDVWNEDREKWIELQRFLKMGKGGSRILVTTRSELTATIIGDDEHTYRLQGLSPKSSWELFRMVAFNQGNDQQKESLEIGENIVAKCFNIPLAIRVVGSLLYGQDISKWRLFEEIGLAEIGKGNNQILSVLKLSYHNLETSFKSCFAYCAIFPKDFRINKEMLINLWIAQGYIVPAHQRQSIDDAAEEHFLVLLRRCFFQDVWKDVYGDVESVKIHDLMHDVAQGVAGEENQILGSSGNNFGDEVYHLSFDGNDCPQSSSRRNKLRSYIDLSSEFVEHVQVVLNNFIFLRVLVIKKLRDIKPLESIGELVHLRYLDLSFSSFEAFPANSITKLHNLQTLILCACFNLRELPHDLRKLVKLRHLDIYACHKLTCMPFEMGKLTGVRVLTLFIVGEILERDHPSDKKCEDQLKDLETLTNLTGSINIRIGKFYRTVKQPMNGSFLSEMKHLKEVHVEFDSRCADEEAILEKLEPHSNVKCFSLEGYNGTAIPWWPKGDNNGAISPNLVQIKVTSCCRLQTLPSFSKLSYLSILELEGLDELEYMENTSSNSSSCYAAANETPFFPSLQILEIRRAPKLKGWFSGESLAAADHCLSRRFPRLVRLAIVECPNFASLPSCPTVKHLFSGRTRIIKQVVGMGNNGTSCLTSLHMQYDEELKSLSELSNVFTICATSLHRLQIYRCPNLESISEGLEHLTALDSLTLTQNKRLNFSGDDIMPWKSFHQSLRTLELRILENMTTLPKGMQHLTSLQTLTIRACPKLNALPEWISSLSSLQWLHILGDRGSILEERCRKPTGIDWLKIQHIPDTRIKFLQPL